MQIKQIRLTHFKLFDRLTLDTRPLTILTGANSSGKSTVLNALAAVSQTQQSRRYPFEFVPNGMNCSLGSYEDIVSGHNTRKSFGIGFSATRGKRHVRLDAKYRYSPRGDHILLGSMSYKAEKDLFRVNWEGQARRYRCQFSADSLRQIGSDPDYRRLLEATEQLAIAEIKKHAKKKAAAEIKRAREFFAVATRRTVHHISSRVPPRDLPDNIRSNATGSYLLTSLGNFMGEFQRTVGYVGPVRAEPLRYYPPDRPHTTIDPSGANCVQLLYDWQKHDAKRFTQVADLMRTLELTRNLRTQGDADEILKMIVRPFRHREKANLPDVGFGVSQALPLVVADVALPDESVLLVNQPEVHLHPTGQAQLANYFVGRLKKRQYVVETHSEYVVNRLRVLAQQGKLDPTQVAIVFFASDARTKSLVKKYDIQLRKDGSLEGAPKQFFQTYYADSFALAMGPAHK